MSSYQALYRKWRPMRFKDVVGQSHVSDTLRTAVSTGRIAHAYLFCGTRGTGKTSTAKIFSRAVNCENPQDGEPCNQCPSCLGILNGSIPDVYEMDAASNRGVDNIREICDEVAYIPIGCKKKIYIIDEVHMLTEEAFNALLKTIEEPPPHAIFILATTEPHRIPKTVLSRCQRFDFRRIGVDDIAARLRFISENENINITADGAELVAELGDGSMRDAVSLLDRCSAFGDEELTAARISDIVGIVNADKIFGIAESIAENNASNALSTAAEIMREGKEPQNLIESLSEHFRALLLCKATDNLAEFIEKSEVAAARFSEQAEKFKTDRLLFSIKTLGEYLAQAKWMSNPKVAVEMALVKLASPVYASDIDALLARIESLETAVAKLSSGVVVRNENTASAPISGAGISTADTGGAIDTASVNNTSAKADSFRNSGNAVHTDDNGSQNTVGVQNTSSVKSSSSDGNTSQGEVLPPWEMDSTTVKTSVDTGKVEDTQKPVQNQFTSRESVQQENTSNNAATFNNAASFVSDDGWDDWSEALNEIKNESKTLYAFLYNADVCLNGDTVEIEVQGEVAYNRIATPNGIEYLSKLFSRLSGVPLRTKVFIKGKREKEEKETSAELSIFDLAKKKSIFGDKMDIEE